MVHARRDGDGLSYNTLVSLEVRIPKKHQLPNRRTREGLKLSQNSTDPFSKGPAVLNPKWSVKPGIWNRWRGSPEYYQARVLQDENQLTPDASRELSKKTRCDDVGEGS